MKSLILYFSLFVIFSSCVSKGGDNFYSYPDSDYYKSPDNNGKTQNDMENEKPDVSDINNDMESSDPDDFSDDDAFFDGDDRLDYSADESYYDDDQVFIDDAESDNDSEIFPECGNGLIENNEKCDTKDKVLCSAIDFVNYESGEASCKGDCSDWIVTDCVEYENCADKPDFPDPDFADTNCDGIDGDIKLSVFVDMYSGDDLNDGSINSPLRSISKGIIVASEAGKANVLVSTGSYENEEILFKDGVSVHGGYSGVPNWTRTSNPLSVTTILSGSAGLIADTVSNVNLSFLKIQSFDASGNGESSVALTLKSCTGVALSNVTLLAGKGSDGTAGVNGLAGDKGGNGGPGNPGCESSTALFCDGPCSQPSGGAGGSSSCGAYGGTGGTPGKSKSEGNPGENGSGSDSNGGTGGTLPVMGEEACYFSSGLDIHGGKGADGANGANGSGGLDVGSFVDGYYYFASGENGVDGDNGQGGGGGGGGMGGKSYCDSYGSSGGGGGAGGCGGKAGTGGQGGGGSFALIIDDSTSILLENIVLESNNGGNGGAAGRGGTLGQYGFGASGGNYGGGGDQDDGGCGGHGGNGGLGGIGGHGGGGGGGPSICFVRDSYSLVEGEKTLSCKYGAGGEGGPSSGNKGKNGFSAKSYIY